ncbi:MULTISPECIES: S8 family serine peptidase [unclassified Crossiella]|uniref:S8 family peptidase n=1 Tax=unclassified Crossiella TaxID=2620835 RepID=UPI002000148F|nr:MULTISPECIES: S8 family serine peptidase [unclassified Crossiella]MCK2241136.1 S8 family serine peptidase [Crossiella sp. S99.2]MCK2253720.1 S8 family serine peptidase [Crossiella sp. S99.1]
MSKLGRLGAATLAMTTGVVLLSGAPAAGAAPAGTPCATEGTSYQYVVVVRPHTREREVRQEITGNCGKFDHYYPEIGVAVATSVDPSFDRRVGLDKAYSAKKAKDAVTGLGRNHTAKLESVQAVVAGDEDLSGQSWDMRAIGADKANKINPGSRDVVVGVLDSGVDPKHPDLVKALDPKLSAGCETGKPVNEVAAWSPLGSAHGTHVAGTIAAAKDGKGITGIAPGVRIASVRVINDEGMIYPESAVCGFMWSAAKKFTLTNNSWFADPFFFWCQDKPGERVGFEAIRRALAYAHRAEVLTVAAAGNFALDLTDPTHDPAAEHPVDKKCKLLPGGLPGVVSVSSTGFDGSLSSFSDYGRGAITVSAPGGDFTEPPPGQGPGCPLSTIPDGQYGSMCGTSMASPHAAGVAALIASGLPYRSAAHLRFLLAAQADPKACPGGDERCTGSKLNNSFFGSGQVNALRAVR